MGNKRVVSVSMVVLVIALMAAMPVAAQLPTTDTLDMTWVQEALQGGFWLFGLFISLIATAVGIIFGSRIVNAVVGFFSKYLKIG